MKTTKKGYSIISVGNGYLVRRSFLALKNCVVYLDYERGWVEKETKTCIFSSKKIAESFAELRLASEKRYGELRTLAVLISQGLFLVESKNICKTVEELCPEFTEIFLYVKHKF